MDLKLFCSLNDYCTTTQRSYSSALRDVKSGRVPSVRIGKTILIPISFLAALARSAVTFVDTQRTTEVSND